MTIPIYLKFYLKYDELFICATRVMGDLMVDILW